jgi:lipopolysaccharide cholinephosphotransferase
LVRISSFPPPKGKYGYCRRWYEELEDIEFEGLTFPGIKDCDGYLRYKFGDYMQLPSEKERHWHPAAGFRLPEDV